MSRPPKLHYNTCEICGTVFEGRTAEVKTCSPDCRRRLKARQMLAKFGRPGSPYRLDSKQCVICSHTYEPVVGSQKTCSPDCGRILRKRRRAERKLAAQEPEPIQFLPLHAAEDVCRKLGMSYGAASAEAFNFGMTLSSYLMLRAGEERIQILKEGDT